MNLNAGQLRAIVEQTPSPLHVGTLAYECPVSITPWNDFGAVLVRIGVEPNERTFVVPRDGRVLPWTGSIADLAEAALDNPRRW